MRTLTFRQRITLFSAAGIALVLLVGSAATYLIVRGQLRGEIDESLREHSAAVEFRTVENRGPTLNADNAPPGSAGVTSIQTVQPEPEFGNAPIFVQVINGQGDAVDPAGSRFALPVSGRAVEVAKTGTGAYYTDVEVRGTDLRMYVSPSGRGHALISARSLSEVNSALSRLGWSLGGTSLAGIALSALVGLGVARGALRPVGKMSSTAERITQTRDLGERIETEGNDELSRLGATFNAMLDSLESAIRSQRQLVADASHELRTPLTSLRMNIDLLRQGVALSADDRQKLLRDVTNEIEELTTLVANLVDLARGSQRDLHLEHVRLDDVADTVVRRAEARFPQLSFVLEAAPTTVWGDQEDLERAAWNLVENAAKWSGDGGHVEVAVAEGELIVRDSGPGVAAADRPFIFDRFYRSEAARGQPGSGLGLAIVRQIAESHGGRVELTQVSGHGAAFRLSFVEANAKPRPMMTNELRPTSGP
jgi:two-component system, OmpR family, sensor histidine kinase MprB